MNLRDFRYFIAVADTRHFGRAAERCFVSQPTLSGQIKKLETELGVSLFERTNKSVSLTPIGEQLLGHARRCVEEADAVGELAQVYKDPMAGPVKLGAIPTISPYLMPLILAPLRASYPNLRLILSEEITDLLLQRLTNHEIDAALIATPVDDPSLTALPLFDEPFWLAHPRNHPLYDKDEITEEDLENLELLLLADGHCLARQVMEVCHLAERREAGAMADLRASSLDTLLQLVGAGFGSTLVPALAVRGSWMTDTGVIARKLSVSDAFRRVSLVWRRTFPRTAALEVISSTILANLPNTVLKLGGPRQ
jgi:LysR family hydrogen peroxide-inducible transcriptional activator